MILSEIIVAIFTISKTVFGKRLQNSRVTLNALPGGRKEEMKGVSREGVSNWSSYSGKLAP